MNSVWKWKKVSLNINSGLLWSIAILEVPLKSVGKKEQIAYIGKLLSDIVDGGTNSVQGSVRLYMFYITRLPMTFGSNKNKAVMNMRLVQLLPSH